MIDAQDAEAVVYITRYALAKQVSTVTHIHTCYGPLILDAAEHLQLEDFLNTLLQDRLRRLATRHEGKCS